MDIEVKKIGRYLACTLASGLIMICTAAHAAWPERTVTLVVPFSAGGNVDLTARLAAERLNAAFGQPFIVENTLGAAGILAAERVMRSRADGYTILVAPMPLMAVSPHTKKLSFDPLKDFTPMALLAHTPFITTVTASFPAQTLVDFIKYVKALPNKVTYGHGGPASGTQLATAIFARRAGLEMLGVPYRGAAPAFVDMLAGNIQVVSATPNEVEPHVASGKIRLLGISSLERSKRYPGVPAIAEIIPGHNFVGWIGLFAPAGTPQAVVDAVSREMASAARDESYRERLDRLGSDAAQQSAQDFKNAIAADYNEMKDVIGGLGLAAK
jgi:tripartite-type tricarboxylate transporter receptor subunit TctC